MSVHDRSAAWFLAQVKPNSINIANRNLTQQGFKTFMPVQKETRQRGGKFVTTTLPLFSGYVFVEIDVAGGLWRKVNSTYGVTRLVSFGKEPAVVPVELVAELMARCDDEGRLLPPKVLQPGDKVAVTVGPFTSFVAEVERISPERRAWVLMELMGGLTRVAVDMNHLKSLPRDPAST